MNAEKKKGGSGKLRVILVVLFLLVITASLYQIFSTNKIYNDEAKIREQMQQFKPAAEPASKDKEVINQSVIDAKKLNPDIVGWISLDGTGVDYPFAKTTDNNFYVRHDVNKEYSYAGTVFMDYRSPEDLSAFSTVLYGHNMKNGTMFSNLKMYDDSEFFNSNSTGKLFLTDQTFEIEIFAYMLVKSYDEIIYSTNIASEYDKNEFIKYIEENALRYRNIKLTPNDKLMILSTCANDKGDVRSVIAVRLINVMEESAYSSKK